jgi:hypothetical protein
MKLRGGVLVGTAEEHVGDLIVDGKKPLHLPRLRIPTKAATYSKLMAAIIPT